MMDHAPLDMRARDKNVTEQMVPAHMLFLMLEECQKAGYEVRSDVMQHLNVAVAAPLAGLDDLSVARLAKKTDDIATSLLHDLSPDDPREGLMICAMLILRLIDEGKWQDVKNQAVLVSMLLMDDVKDEHKGKGDTGPFWRLEEQKWKDAAGKLMVRAMLQGLYV
ncbi:hypothetical protein [Brucella intermedia]|uniref:hypothetical protein n=1 Tax=Brucella intermedia TaxID=94625 RepID=UPI00224A7F1E|nr:hypothetical protein [Brucella intermedia]